MHTFRLVFVAIVLVGMVANCSRPAGDCTETNMPRVSGTWKGVVHLGARGTVPITFNLNQNNECVNGAWMSEDDTALGSSAGAVTGSVDEMSRLELILDPIGWDACALDAALTLRDGVIAGSIRHRDCPTPVSGSLELNQIRRHREQ